MVLEGLLGTYLQRALGSRVPSSNLGFIPTALETHDLK